MEQVDGIQEKVLHIKYKDERILPNLKILQGVQEKLCFFHNSLQPLPRLHRCKRPSKLSTKSECTVIPPIGCSKKITSAGNLLYNQ